MDARANEGTGINKWISEKVVARQRGEMDFVCFMRALDDLG